MYIFILKNWRMINMKIKRNEAKILVPIISAYAEGRILQYKEEEGWRDIEDSEGLSINTIIKDAENYRIKPEPKYRPFKDAEECWAEMQKHQPFVWVKDKDTQKFLVCKALGKLFFIGIEDKPYNYKEVLRDYTFADGTPFGVEVEE